MTGVPNGDGLTRQTEGNRRKAKENGTKPGEIIRVQSISSGRPLAPLICPSQPAVGSAFAALALAIFDTTFNG